MYETACAVLFLTNLVTIVILVFEIGERRKSQQELKRLRESSHNTIVRLRGIIKQEREDKSWIRHYVREPSEG